MYTRRMFPVFVLALILFTTPAFAQIINTATGLGSPSIKDNNQNQNTNLNTDVNTNTNVNTFIPVNTNIQGQANFQNISPEQTVTFKSPTQLLAPPSQGLSELNFGNGKMTDAKSTLPKFAIYGIKYLEGEAVREVLSVNANVKFKNLYASILDDAKNIAAAKGFKSSEVRLQVIRAEAQKTWASGGNLGGAGSGVALSGLAGGSMAGSIIPQWGGTKADDLFTIIFVKVSL